eukprot:2002290-Rhodomonas_salina.2
MSATAEDRAQQLIALRAETKAKNMGPFDALLLTLIDAGLHSRVAADDDDDGGGGGGGDGGGDEAASASTSMQAKIHRAEA